MKRRNIMTALVVAILGMGLIAVKAEEKKVESKKQTTCPVMGGKINKAQFVDAKGVRIYVCCPGCISKVKADPDKYIKELESKGIELEKTPEKKDDSAAHAGHQH
jgi:hypothetical protein